MPPKRGQAAAGAAEQQAGKKKQKQGEAEQAAPSAAADDSPIAVSRAPVLTLWAAAVAQRQGHSWEAALTFAHLVQKMAQSKKLERRRA